jgi:hypothetical protein
MCDGGVSSSDLCLEYVGPEGLGGTVSLVLALAL